MPQDDHVVDQEKPANTPTTNSRSSAGDGKRPVGISPSLLARRSGLINAFSILSQVTEGNQFKESGYPVRDRKLTQKAVESKNQTKKKNH